MRKAARAKIREQREKKKKLPKKKPLKKSTKQGEDDKPEKQPEEDNDDDDEEDEEEEEPEEIKKEEIKKEEIKKIETPTPKNKLLEQIKIEKKVNRMSFNTSDLELDDIEFNEDELDELRKIEEEFMDSFEDSDEKKPVTSSVKKEEIKTVSNPTNIDNKQEELQKQREKELEEEKFKNQQKYEEQERFRKQQRESEMLEKEKEQQELENKRNQELETQKEKQHQKNLEKEKKIEQQQEKERQHEIEKSKQREKDLEVLKEKEKKMEEEKIKKQQREKEVELQKQKQLENQRIREYEEKKLKESRERVKQEQIEKNSQLEKQRQQKMKEKEEQEELEKKNKELLREEQKKIEMMKIKRQQELENKLREEQKKKLEQQTQEEQKNKQLREEKSKLEEQKMFKMIEEMKKQNSNVTKNLLETLNKKEEDYESEFKFLHIQCPRKYIYSVDSFHFLSRKLNLPFNPPQYIFISQNKKEKERLVDSILGESLFGSLQIERPVYIHIKYNQKLSLATFLFSRDIVAQRESLETTQISEANKEISERNIPSNQAIHISYSSKDFYDIRLVLMPPLEIGESSSNLITEVVKNDINSTLIFVESSPEEWGQESTKLSPLRKSLDPSGQRSLCVYSDLDKVLEKNYTNKDVAHYFGTSPNASRSFPLCFFVSYPKSVKYEEIMKISEEQLNLVRNQRGYVLSNNQMIGVIAICREILKRSVSYYKINVLTNISLNINKDKKNFSENLNVNKTLLDGVKNVSQMRSFVSNYVVKYLQLFSSIYEGHIVANPSTYGQSTKEEKMRSGEWINEKRQIVSLSPKEIPDFSAKIYGVKQIERLLSEFKKVMLSIDLSEFSIHKIANSHQNGDHSSSILFSSFQIVTNKVVPLFKPFVSQLLRRAVYIAKRLVFITNNTFTSHSPLFSTFLHSSVVFSIEKFVQNLSTFCQEKFDEEFICTQFLLFDPYRSSEFSGVKPSEKISTHSTSVLTELRNTIIENISLKLYQFFIEPLYLFFFQTFFFFFDFFL